MSTGIDPKRLRAKRQATEIMEAVAADRETITYSQLTSRIKAVRYAPNGSPLSDLLCEISRATNAKDGVLLSAVVVHQDDRLPGDGFFTLARDLKRPVDDEASFHGTALAEVHERYGATAS